MSTSPRVLARDVVPLIRAVYAQPEHGVGGCLHVVLDDLNVETPHILWCLNEWGCCDVCRRCAELMLKQTVTARRKAIRLGGRGA